MNHKNFGVDPSQSDRMAAISDFHYNALKVKGVDTCCRATSLHESGLEKMLAVNAL